MVLLITLLQVLIFLSFPYYLYRRHGVLSSISAGSYRLEGNKKAWFAVWLVVLGLSMYWQGLGFWGSMFLAGLCIAGMSWDHKKRDDTREDEMHTFGTIWAMASAFFGLWWMYGVWIPAVAMAVGAGVIYLLRRKKGDYIWWIEIWAMVTWAAGRVFA